MLHLTSLDEGLEVFKALGSDTRIQILNLLLENKQMSMNQLASSLNLSVIVLVSSSICFSNHLSSPVERNA